MVYFLSTNLAITIATATIAITTITIITATTTATATATANPGAAITTQFFHGPNSTSLVIAPWPSSWLAEPTAAKHSTSSTICESWWVHAWIASC